MWIWTLESVNQNYIKSGQNRWKDKMYLSIWLNMVLQKSSKKLPFRTASQTFSPCCVIIFVVLRKEVLKWMITDLTCFAVNRNDPDQNRTRIKYRYWIRVRFYLAYAFQKSAPSLPLPPLPPPRPPLIGVFQRFWSACCPRRVHTWHIWLVGCPNVPVSCTEWRQGKGR